MNAWKKVQKSTSNRTVYDNSNEIQPTQYLKGLVIDQLWYLGQILYAPGQNGALRPIESLSTLTNSQLAH